VVLRRQRVWPVGPRRYRVQQQDPPHYRQ